jgi:hypothetical protein
VPLAADVWAFGVTMWEMTSGFRAHCGRNNCTIKQIVTSGKGALEPAQSTPQAFKVLPRRLASIIPFYL